jgi:hypothetical protein
MNLQVTGQLAGIEARNGGWFAVHIQEEGQQWPRKLSTKKPDLLQLAQSLIGQQVTALYNESESTSINPHSGQPYINRYLEALGLAGSMPQQPIQQQPAQQYTPPPQQFVPQQQPVMQQPVQQSQYTPPPVSQGDAQREAKIHRQSAAKVVAAFLPLLQPEDQNLASLIRISEQLVQYFDNGVNWQVPPVQPNPHPHNPSNPGYPATQEQQPVNPEAYGPPPTDDDIPF